MGEVRGHFRPEFLNRVDEIILFHRLRREEMGAIVEDHMFPDLVAERDRIMFHAEPREQRERLGVIDDARRVERIVEQHDAGARRKRGSELGLGEWLFLGRGEEPVTFPPARSWPLLITSAADFSIDQPMAM